MNIIWTLARTVIFGTGLWVWGSVAKDAIIKGRSKDEPIVQPIILMHK